MKIETPPSLKAEHDALHAALAAATREPGRTGEAARAVARVLHPHFEKEEEYALPPLGLLRDLSEGRVTPGMADVIAMTETLEVELPRMLAEHKDIAAALDRLIDAAKAEGKPDVVRFAKELMQHARIEEEIAYPAALLVGRYVKAALARADAGEATSAW